MLAREKTVKEIYRDTLEDMIVVGISEEAVDRRVWKKICCAKPKEKEEEDTVHVCCSWYQDTWDLY